MDRPRRAIVLLGVVFSGVLLAGLCSTVYRVDRAERDYLLGKFVVQLVEDYARERGDWPRSWRDLEQMGQPEERGWPRDSPLVQSRIHVDFAARIGDLAGQDVDQFRAVHPIEPNALFDDRDLRRGPIGSLLGTLRRLVEERGTH